jgi:Na+/melibiose symporter-like transporter
MIKRVKVPSDHMIPILTMRPTEPEEKDSTRVAIKIEGTVIITIMVIMLVPIATVTEIRATTAPAIPLIIIITINKITMSSQVLPGIPSMHEEVG